jgi:hypothetical protein
MKADFTILSKYSQGGFIMKKTIALVLVALFAAFVCLGCVSRNNYKNYERDRDAATDATGRMNNAGK